MHERFLMTSPDDIRETSDGLGVEVPWCDSTAILGDPIDIAGRQVPNRLAVQPMEGCDGTAAGEPGELTLRRYRRFAAGGAGLLWFEATAVVQEGRANPRQLVLNARTAPAFREMLESALAKSRRARGDKHRPFTVLQLTHSGRYSRPVDAPAPIIAARNPHLDPYLKAPARTITDDELDELAERYAETAVLAADTGFDAVDIKSCHRYLVSELLSAHERPGRYGGSFANRIRFLLDVAGRVLDRTKGRISVTPRLNVYDAIPHPYGWGMKRDGSLEPDLAEPVELARKLFKLGVPMINVTAGNPYYNPHVNRPYDAGPYVPREHPLAGVARLLGFVRAVGEAVPGMIVVASGLSWLRDFGANVAAGGIESGWFSLAGFGRQAFAYPRFAADILDTGAMDGGKCCVACGKCSEIMRYGGCSGCVVRDRDVYLPIYRESHGDKTPLTAKTVADHV